MSEENGIERYIEIAREIDTAPGPIGPIGPTCGPKISQTDLVPIAAVIGVEQTVSEYAVAAGALQDNDIMFIEWWGYSTNPVGFIAITINVYWNNILIGTINETTVSSAHTCAIMELFENYIAFSAYSLQYNNTHVHEWRQTGGTIRITITSTINQTTAMGIRYMQVSKWL